MEHTGSSRTTFSTPCSEELAGLLLYLELLSADLSELADLLPRDETRRAERTLSLFLPRLTNGASIPLSYYTQIAGQMLGERMWSGPSRSLH